MAIHNQLEKSMSGGVTKRIEASAIKMMLDNLQKDQYQNPIKSTIREVVCNGIDSNVEKNTARNILTGANTVEDYFEPPREEEEYQDSKFDPTYYDLNWLCDDDFVSITYVVGKELERDKVIISDNGVGLGSYRLEKYFSLGYSTKRLAKMPLGKFGIGGKAPLSIVDYFTMESRYNGRLYRFNIYSHTFDSIIPSINMETGEFNDFIIFDEGTDHEYTVYYEKTEQKNGVTIIVEAKKAHKQQYVDAVKSQLLYFPNIIFNIHDIEDNLVIPVNYKANILYEDDYIVLSDNNYWSKPHLLLNKVNYGYINWAELELEDKTGNIGIKIAPEDVSINPSRESIKWDDATKTTVLNRFNIVVEIASKLIQEELKDTDYLKWIRNCYSIIGKSFSERTIVGRLAKIVDISNVKPSFLPEPKLKFQQTKVLNGLYVRSVKIQRRMLANSYKYHVERKETRAMADVIVQQVYLMKNGEKASNRKDKYLYSLHQEGFMLIMEPLTSREGMISIGMSEEYADSMLSLFNREGEEFRVTLGVAWDHLIKSQDVKWYSEVEVPDDFKATNDEIDEEDIIDENQKTKDELKAIKSKQQQKEDAKIAQMSRLERRKLEGKTLIYTPRAIDRIPKVREGENTVRIFDWQKIEIPIKEMNDWQAEEIYYGIGPGTDELLHFVAFLTRDPYHNNVPGQPIRSVSHLTAKEYSVGEWIRKSKIDVNNIYGIGSDNAFYCQHYFDNKEIMLVKASSANAKYMRDFRPIEQFFQVVRNKTLTMSNVLIRWNTARIIKAKLHHGNFLFNFETFNPTYAKMYEELCRYVDNNYRDVVGHSTNSYFGLGRSTYTDLITHLDKVQQFQEFIATAPTDKEVADMAQFMFANKELQDGQAVDPTIMVLLTKVLEYSTATGIMFNYMSILTGMTTVNSLSTYQRGLDRSKNRIPVELEMELKQFLDYKGLLDYGQEEDEIKEFQEQMDHIGQEPTILPEEEQKPDLPGVDNQSFTLVLTEPFLGEIKRQQDIVQVLKPEEHKSNDLEIPDDQAIIQSF